MRIRLYGWYEQNGASYGVEAIEVEHDGSMVEDASTGQVSGNTVPGDGKWFLRFTQATRACLVYWRSEVKIAKEAIKAVKAQRS